MSSSVGTLSFTVWPVYAGAAMEGATPPFSINEPHNGGYARAQITWEPNEQHQIVGRARITCPPGTYTHLCFFHTPGGPQACGISKMAHPITFIEPVNVLDVYPIINSDLALSTMRNIHP